MLIDFSVSNFRSVHQRQTLSMAATVAYDELLESNTFEVPAAANLPRLVRSAVLYGPNASGKSTLISALNFVQSLVLRSHTHQAGDPLEVVPFKLTPESRVADSEFEITFVAEGVRYEYGVCCNAVRVTEEWLFAYPQGRAQKWFHRVWDAKQGREAYKYSPHFSEKKLRESWAKQTLENTLYLSKAVQNKQEQLRPVFEWFKERLRVIPAPQALTDDYTKKRCQDALDRRRILDFMNMADLCIADLRLEESTFPADELPKDLPSAVRDHIVKEMDGKKFTSIKFVHQDTVTGEGVEFTEVEESDGTRALFAFAGPWLDVTENSRVLVVDELDTSLHPMLVHYLVKRLHAQNSKAQLIFTTHDTTLLSQKILRRDQIWFMEKDAQRASRLYPLSDFSPREHEAIERGYLNGRYGGIPFLKDLDFYGV